MHITWDTRHIAPARRGEFWRSAVCEAFLAMTPRIAACRDFHARLDHSVLERLTLNRVSAPPHGVLRTPLDLARGGAGYVFLNLNGTGRGFVRQSGREHLAAPGELMLIDSTVPYLIELLDSGELLSLALPIDLLRSAMPELGDRIARAVPTTPATHMLRAQLTALADCVDALEPAQAGVVADVLLALTAASLSTSPVQRKSGGLIRRLRTLIAQHFDYAGFGPAQAAQLAGVSVRGVHAALAREGSTFGTEQMEYRLQRARQRLIGADPHLRVAAVASECGFRSPEHFSRRFHARFGFTPESCLRRSFDVNP